MTTRIRKRESLGGVQELEEELQKPARKKALVKGMDIAGLVGLLKKCIEYGDLPDFLDEEISNYTKQTKASIPFSSITNSQEKELEVKGTVVKFKENELEPIKPSEHFDYFSNLIAERWNLKAEIGRRTLCDLYFLEACSSLTKEENIAVFPEHTISGAQITNEICCHGSLDWCVANAKHEPGLREESLAIGIEDPAKPFFCAMEAKKDKSFGEGKGQTLAEIKALWKLGGGETAVNGVLTDGLRWIFFRLAANGRDYRQTKIISHEKPHILLGILREFIRGNVPKGIDL